MKIKNQKITAELLKNKVSAKYGKAKWILFCEVLLPNTKTSVLKRLSDMEFQIMLVQ